MLLRATPGIASLWPLLGFSTVLLWGCAGVERDHASPNPVQARELLDRSIPRDVPDRAGWIDDLYAGFTALGVAPTHDNICAVAAVIEQESGFRVDPVIPGLPAIAWREIDERAAQAGVPKMIVHGLLELKSPTGRTYGDRINTARTEKQLSDTYEDFIGSVPMGQTLFADHNPIRTRGPMQVHVAFAEQFSRARPYPYPVAKSIPDEVFTRRGGLYFGIAHLLAYPAPYESQRFRFADFNAGQYASRNAAFQNALRIASGIPLTADGALLGDTEMAARTLGTRLGIGDDAIHHALEQAKSPGFSRSPLYEKVFALADDGRGHPVPRALVPQIELHGPKITRKLTTAWYAQRVTDRFARCMAGTRG